MKKLKFSVIVLLTLVLCLGCLGGCVNAPGKGPSEDPDDPIPDPPAPPSMTKQSFREDYLTYLDGVPTLNLTAESVIESKDDYVKGTLSIDDPLGKFSTDAPISMEIRGRGNSTWGLAKKPFRIKMKSKTSIFGKPKVKNYALVANYSDKSYLRNYMAYALARSFDSMDYNPDVIPVEVYLKTGGGGNEYLGLYGLTDQMESGESRVNVEGSREADNAFGIETGFMVEIDDRADFPEEGNLLGRDYFVYQTRDRNPSLPSGVRNYKMVLKYPKFDDEDYEENPTRYQSAFNYVKDYCTRFLDSVFKRDYNSFSALCDEESFADFFMVHEIMANVDAHYLSLFLNKGLDRKMQAGPVWDFDIAAGNCYYQFANTNEPSGIDTWNDQVWMGSVYDGMFLSTSGLPKKNYNLPPHYDGDIPAQDWYIRAINPIFAYLMKNNTFKSLYRERYLGYYDLNIAFWLDSFDYAGQKLDTVQTNAVKSPAAKDREKWNLATAYVWPNPMKVVKTPNYVGENSQVKFLRDYLAKRTAALYNLVQSPSYV